VSEFGKSLLREGPPPRDARWKALLAEPSRLVADLVKLDLPSAPGVYLWRHKGRPVYVGQSSNLQRRIWQHHLGRGANLGASSLRRNVAELVLGIPTTATRRGRTRLVPADVDVVSRWLQSCELSWQLAASSTDAVELERALRAS